MTAMLCETYRDLFHCASSFNEHICQVCLKVLRSSFNVDEWNVSRHADTIRCLGTVYRDL
jgi:hypothetical protein